MEQNNVNIQMDIGGSAPIRATLAGAIPTTAAEQFSPEAEAKKLLEIMGSSGVISKEYIDKLLGEVKELSPIYDAEIVEDGEVIDE